MGLSAQHPQDFGSPPNSPLKLRETPYVRSTHFPLSVYLYAGLFRPRQYSLPDSTVPICVLPDRPTSLYNIHCKILGRLPNWSLHTPTRQKYTINTLNSNNSRNYINPRNTLVYLNTMTITSTKHVLTLQGKRQTSWLHLPPQEDTTRKGGNLLRRQHKVAKQPQTTVYDLFRVQYTIPVPSTISEIHIPIRTIATYVLLALDVMHIAKLYMNWVVDMTGWIWISSFKDIIQDSIYKGIQKNNARCILIASGWCVVLHQ